MYPYECNDERIFIQFVSLILTTNIREIIKKILWHYTRSLHDLCIMFSGF